MKVELKVSNLTSDERAEFQSKVKELTEENIMIFNSDETAEDGAILEMITEKHEGLFQFLRTVKVRMI